MKQFIELILLAFKKQINFLHEGWVIYNNKTKDVWSVWSERYKACNELFRLSKKYPEEKDYFEILRF